MSTRGTIDASSERSETASRILDVAQEMVQRRGYNGVSYADLAAELDLTTAAIHYHFPSKADLGRELVARYRRTNAAHRDAIREETSELKERLEQYVELYGEVLRSDGLCLCGVLAADEMTLPESVREEVRRFFAEQEDWLAEVIEDGATAGSGFAGRHTSREVAELFLAAVEGAMLTSRAQRKGTEAYTFTLQRLINSLVP